MNTVDTLNANLNKTLAKGRVKATKPPACPAIGLYLFDPAVLQGPLSHDEAQAVVAEPAYWSFCWASGQVLAQFILENPEYVRGKTVLDFGSGSGVVAVAAAKAGAKKVIACDIDSDALEACRANAELNSLSFDYSEDFMAFDEELDLITAADVLYDKDNHDLLDLFTTKCPQVLLADSRVKVLPSSAYDLLEVKEARTCPDLNEFEEFNKVRIYHSNTCS
ncbi:MULTISPECIES: methyltransferase [unclassified Oleiphilus]|uniref:class I SAM-dependent methyltransferase n=2 Tax=Oleiphilus TaxID=141450 RepID=UPI0007C4002F|nr:MULTISPECIES: 50S ribosomal protein L11 methyltransferase [unclassified Oleiphilus]KZY41471.1 methyltransferase type 12 [Oleiphilus sp. HI0050]KZY89145.1 methyltransferase type 12 [Oleiphilus sp. HI0072]KZZ11350.1 methyltransferase type 12 [Oleiphilus sp. HI0078]KZZ29666.1 methyltransferase type 12 [Oleiphilus sp. HI0081]KZY37661.1 methyltransferase type 12 [Oleiphilus sp. HI0043]